MSGGKEVSLPRGVTETCRPPFSRKPISLARALSASTLATLIGPATNCDRMSSGARSNVRAKTIAILSGSSLEPAGNEIVRDTYAGLVFMNEEVAPC